MDFDEFDIDLDELNYDNETDSYNDDFKKRLYERIEQSKKEQEELYNPSTKYNEETLQIFDQFAKDFIKLYPDLLSYDEIIIRLKANIKEDILFTDEMRNGISGYFNPIEHKVAIKKGMKELETKAVIFHELIHSLVESNPFEFHDDSYLFDESYSEDETDYYQEEYGAVVSSFMTESITTIIQEDYEKTILGLNRRRVNGYIPTYARQLRAIFGNEIINEYIGKYKDIRTLFKYSKIGDEKISIDNMCSSIDEIDTLIKDGKSNEASIESSNIEINIAHLLKNYLSNNNLSDENKISIIENLVKEQIFTDFDYIKNIIEKVIDDKSLIKNSNIVNYIYNVNSSNYESLVNQIVHNSLNNNKEIDDEEIRELVRLRIKYDDYNIMKYFGFTDFSYDSKNKKYTYDVENNMKFLNNKEYYITLYDLSNEISLDNITSIKGTKKNNKENIIKKLKNGSKEEELVLNGEDLILGSIFGKTSCLKLSSNEEVYYILLKDTIEVKRQMTIDKAIELYISLMNDHTGLKEGYKLAIEELKKLSLQGIDNVFVDEYGFIRENDSNIVSTNIYFEDDDIPAELEYETIELEELDMPFLKKNTKKI